MKVPNTIEHTSRVLSPRYLLDTTTDYIYERTQEAKDEIERLDYELKFLAPRVVAWSQAEREASKRGELDPFNTQSHEDENDWQETSDRFRVVHTERAEWEAVLQRFAFWRQAIMYGVPKDQVTSERAAELWAIAHEVCADAPAAQWEGYQPSDLIALLEAVN